MTQFFFRRMSFPYHLTHSLWQRQGFLAGIGWLALTPLSLGFSVLVRGRNLLYDCRWFSVTQPTLKIISVGNLTVGGTGKTPVVLWIAQALQERGHHVGIITRGYGGKNKGLTVVGTSGNVTATPDEVGDEA